MDPHGSGAARLRGGLAVHLAAADQRRVLRHPLPGRIRSRPTSGLRLLRVAARARAERGPAPVGPFYQAVSNEIFGSRRAGLEGSSRLLWPSGIAGAVTAASGSRLASVRLSRALRAGSLLSLARSRLALCAARDRSSLTGPLLHRGSRPVRAARSANPCRMFLPHLRSERSVPPGKHGPARPANSSARRFGTGAASFQRRCGAPWSGGPPWPSPRCRPGSGCRPDALVQPKRWASGDD